MFELEIIVHAIIKKSRNHIVYCHAIVNRQVRTKIQQPRPLSNHYSGINFVYASVAEKVCLSYNIIVSKLPATTSSYPGTKLSRMTTVRYVYLYSETFMLAW